jgi:hypothetical protein
MEQLQGMVFSPKPRAAGLLSAPLSTLVENQCSLRSCEKHHSEMIRMAPENTRAVHFDAALCESCCRSLQTIPCHRAVEQQKKETVIQRQHNRYRLAATVSFSWKAENHRVNHGSGQTRDCSISGAFIFSPDKLPIGSILQMEFSLPRLLAAGPGARLKTRGRVIRVEPEGFAVLVEMRPASLMHRSASPVSAGFGAENVSPAH